MTIAGASVGYPASSSAVGPATAVISGWPARTVGQDRGTLLRRVLMHEMASRSLISDARMGMKLGMAWVATCGLRIEVTNRRPTPGPECADVNFPLSIMSISWGFGPGALQQV